jgi:hypothetical protein
MMFLVGWFFLGDRQTTRNILKMSKFALNFTVYAHTNISNDYKGSLSVPPKALRGIWHTIVAATIASPILLVNSGNICTSRGGITFHECTKYNEVLAGYQSSAVLGMERRLWELILRLSCNSIKTPNAILSHCKDWGKEALSYLSEQPEQAIARQFFIPYYSGNLYQADTVSPHMQCVDITMADLESEIWIAPPATQLDLSTPSSPAIPSSLPSPLTKPASSSSSSKDHSIPPAIPSPLPPSLASSSSSENHSSPPPTPVTPSLPKQLEDPVGDVTAVRQTRSKTKKDAPVSQQDVSPTNVDDKDAPPKKGGKSSSKPKTKSGVF